MVIKPPATSKLKIVRGRRTIAQAEAEHRAGRAGAVGFSGSNNALFGEIRLRSFRFADIKIAETAKILIHFIIEREKPVG